MAAYPENPHIEMAAYPENPHIVRNKQRPSLPFACVCLDLALER